MSGEVFPISTLNWLGRDGDMRHTNLKNSLRVMEKGQNNGRCIILRTEVVQRLVTV